MKLVINWVFHQTYSVVRRSISSWLQRDAHSEIVTYQPINPPAAIYVRTPAATTIHVVLWIERHARVYGMVIDDELCIAFRTSDCSSFHPILHLAAAAPPLPSPYANPWNAVDGSVDCHYYYLSVPNCSYNSCRVSSWSGIQQNRIRFPFFPPSAWQDGVYRDSSACGSAFGSIVIK